MGKQTTKDNSLSFRFDVKPSKPLRVPDIYECGDTIKASLQVENNGEKPFSHRGIEFEFCTEYSVKGQKPVKFNHVTMKLAENSQISDTVVYTDLPECTIDRNMPTYHGESFSIRHILRATVKNFLGSIEYEEELIAYQFNHVIKSLDPMFLRIAVTGSVRIDLILTRRKYELSDIINGCIRFLQADLKLKCVNVALLAQESTEVQGKIKQHNYNVATYEISDGAPVKDEIIPFRIYLNSIDVSPTTVNPEKGYSVSHYLNFEILTTTNKRYFKSIQIKLLKCVKPPFIFTNNLEEFHKESHEIYEDEFEEDDFDILDEIKQSDDDEVEEEYNEYEENDNE
ncbi:Vacuolar protein sorting-associated protein 26B-B [Tritrichomonas foetus]|uniref:Vacuolar protein sorting-associated protein 26B-B n=1 Tax=Tritrichomonas foetus TaxID=1144522 RepID=A0A1J4JKU0_9EUKA|nr:Vacuolar protein sorting-associated protein 26B-B [Tritrichomonas foetus]|eukprot:OHS97884.1 Vacuolar protein sorting-associated protein 26B-B [Tritrichomonas foetus]